MTTRPNGGDYTIYEWYEEREIPSNPILCWNCSDTESRRMWDEYTTCEESIVLQSTLGRLKECFADTQHEVMIGLIEYGDHNDIASPRFAVSQWGDSSASIPPNPWYVPRWFKRAEFKHESELRATTYVSQRDHPFEKGFNVIIGKSGVTSLVQTIRLHPNARSGFLSTVKDLLCCTGFPAIPVTTSAFAAVNGS